MGAGLETEVCAKHGSRVVSVYAIIGLRARARARARTSTVQYR